VNSDSGGRAGSTPAHISPENFRSGLEALRGRKPFRFPAEAVPDDFRKAAVLIAFWPDRDDLRCALTRRTQHLSSHKGQVAFPGGRVDPGESFREAALREAHEEVGLDPSSVEVIGDLDDAWSGAGHHIVPVVGWLEAPPRLRPNPAEVAEILLPRVSELLQPHAHSVQKVTRNGRVYVNHVLAFGAHSVFGLSTDLLMEALAWGTGSRPERGPERLEELARYHRNAG
jgi:8-oxo-dGTP pyrophosphatase MutT (NUDIX family)